MGFIYIPKATIDVGEITVELTPPTPGTGTVTQLETTSSFSIPAGQRYVEIYVAGAVQSGDLEVNATIQGQSISIGNTYKYTQTLDAVNNVLELSPAITGNGNGTRLFIKYWS